MNLASASTNANNIYKMYPKEIGIGIGIGWTISKRLAEKKAAMFQRNITERGSVDGSTKKGNGYPVGPILLGFFFFVVVGSSLFQIIRTATRKGMV